MQAVKPIVKTETYDKIKYYETHLRIINVFLPVNIATKEIEVLARFMAMEGDIAKDRFGTTARGLVKQSFKKSLSDASLSNYIRILKAKGLITNDNKIHKILSVDKRNQMYQFILKIKEDVDSAG